jgi:hypothetical protein
MDDHQVQIILESFNDKIDIIIKNQAALGQQLDDMIRESREQLNRSKAEFQLMMSQRNASRQEVITEQFVREDVAWGLRGHDYSCAD